VYPELLSPFADSGMFPKTVGPVRGAAGHAQLARDGISARAYVLVNSVRGPPPDNVQRAQDSRDRRHPELRQQLWTNIRCLRTGFSSSGTRLDRRVADCAHPHCDEDRTIAFWQQLLTAGLYVNLIVRPAVRRRCVLRASCSAAYTPST